MPTLRQDLRGILRVSLIIGEIPASHLKKMPLIAFKFHFLENMCEGDVGREESVACVIIEIANKGHRGSS